MKHVTLLLSKYWEENVDMPSSLHLSLQFCHNPALYYETKDLKYGIHFVKTKPYTIQGRMEFRNHLIQAI